MHRTLSIVAHMAVASQLALWAGARALPAPPSTETTQRTAETARPTAETSHPREETARIVWVHDGDTVTVRQGSRKSKVRLIGIDSDELSDRRPPWRKLAYEERDYAIRRLKGQKVTLRADPLCSDRDDYGRLLRYVILSGGTNFNEEMIRRGHARAFTRFPFGLSKGFVSAEREARRAGIGRWASDRKPPD